MVQDMHCTSNADAQLPVSPISLKLVQDLPPHVVTAPRLPPLGQPSLQQRLLPVIWLLVGHNLRYAIEHRREHKEEGADCHTQPAGKQEDVRGSCQ